ncbi:RNA polymerase sigma factor [Rhizobium lentis]|uniref:RNA polymerase sigma factor n=1 Tax=Rhizobium lentis TaxID=1138194 RepID=UPI001C83DF5A|nr:RNA polymerase sigma factor [Rhizobium lentis]MBX5049591.1 RNA polymerase sigma factor [Rhizobium lentis]MBX5061280.1 RNA polymerase sigma factor [Rhizobium lentis]
MTGNDVSSELFAATFGLRLGKLRPKLHRYCARMTGSVIDGEDVLQDALAKAMEALPAAAPITNPQGWLFRIVHNTALDFLRRRARQADHIGEEEAEMVAEPLSQTEARQIAATSLRTFMRLPVRERSCIILMDVLGYSLSELCSITGMTMPAVKALLHRGRVRLRDIAAGPDDHPLPVLSAAEKNSLAFYVDRFNARDFEALKDRLAEDAKAELVGEVVMRGRDKVSTYFGNYAREERWWLAPGLVEGRPAALVFEQGAVLRTPAYFIVLDWSGDSLLAIRDFRYARYALEAADIKQLGADFVGEA